MLAGKRSARGESALIFQCDGTRLVGMLHYPDRPATEGIIVVVGGPQYRVGSHRQFVEFARALAAGGIAALRFDYRGLGDSEGTYGGFLSIDADIRAAVDHLLAAEPTISKVFLWGLCDAATALSFYGALDPRVSGLVLLNPWLGSGRGMARAYIKHYYRDRALDLRTWVRILRGKLDWKRSARSLAALAVNAIGLPSGSDVSLLRGLSAEDVKRVPEDSEGLNLSTLMLERLQAFGGVVKVILSGNDLTASEFWDTAQSSRAWRRYLRSSVVSVDFVREADHTFSRSLWKREVERLTCEWIYANAGWGERAR